VAVLPDNDTVVAPADCTVVNIADTLHAFGLETDDGLEVLIHIGIDTVKLNGKGFTLLCQEGDRVTAGTPLCKVDFDLVKAEGYATWTPVIITNMDAIAAMSLNSGTVTVGETAVIKYEKR
jgi:glucose-specific phosphotransferase system IIA component